MKRLEKRKRYAPPGFVIALLLTLIVSPVSAQSQRTTPVTIDQAVREAVEENISLLAERYNLSVPDARTVTARMRPNPVLSIYAGPLDLETGHHYVRGKKCRLRRVSR